MTSKSARHTTRAFVWTWLPGATSPVVCGAIDRTTRVLDREPVVTFTYASSYLARPDAVSLFPAELPLRRVVHDPTAPERNPDWSGFTPEPGWAPLPLAGCLRDAAPDAWGRRVINVRLTASADTELDDFTYLLESGSDRIGALDFQASATEFEARGSRATLEQLSDAVAGVNLIEAGEPLPPELVAAAAHGTEIGGARPKATVYDGDRALIAKFSSTSDVRPVVKAETVAMLLAKRVGLSVANVELTRADKKDVLLVERFDRQTDGSRRMMLSALTVLGCRAGDSRYMSYADLASAIKRPGWKDPSANLREMFTRLVFNVCVGNNDDHLRNHAAFWDGTALTLTPAYDICPGPRSTNVSSQAIGITRDGKNASQLRLCRAVAHEFLLSRADADAIIDHVVSAITEHWADACDEAQLTHAERNLMWGREILNDYINYDEA